MKLAIVRQKYTPFGGAERFVARALAALRERGTDVSIVARQWSGDVQGVACNPFYLGRWWRDASFCHAVQRIIAEGRFDLVQSHERIPGCHLYRAGDGVHATWLERRDATRPRPAALATALSPWHRYTLAAEDAMFRHPALRAVICNSRMVKDDIARRFGVAESRLHVIHNGIDLAHFHPGLRGEHRTAMRAKVGAGGTAKVVLFVGSGYERKGLPTLLRAMAGGDAELWVVGRDKDETLLRKLAQTLGVDDRVRWFGGQEDVRPYYGAADVFALPTLYDPLPNAALEALACGLPVLTTPACGAAELLSADSGTVVAAGDVAAIRQALGELCARSETMREAARASVAALDLPVMTDRLLALYDALMRR